MPPFTAPPVVARGQVAISPSLIGRGRSKGKSDLFTSLAASQFRSSPQSQFWTRYQEAS
ncbi:hypothetical protein LIA77_11397 [Sarocladium implicatum]|nr:hypothetical protein LIA77_11397 [Sarocladium implicatum]